MDIATSRIALISSLLLFLAGCTTKPAKPNSTQPQTNQTDVEHPAVPDSWECVGEVGPPPSAAGKLVEVDMPESYQSAIQPPPDGGLCEAKAYKVTNNFEIFRGWNATFEGGKFGKWWAFEVPSKDIATYRKNYAVCYTYSALDMLVRCNIKEGTVIAIGTGQKAKCDKYFTYDLSPTIQIYLPEAESATMDCKNYVGNFAWDFVLEPQPPTAESDADNSDESEQ